MQNVGQSLVDAVLIAPDTPDELDWQGRRPVIYSVTLVF
jgi:hypothetical protein